MRQQYVWVVVEAIEAVPCLDDKKITIEKFRMVFKTEHEAQAYIDYIRKMKVKVLGSLKIRRENP